MRHPVKYTLLGFHLISLTDNGEKLDIQETREKMRRGKLFSWLKTKYKDKLDISIYPHEELNEMETFFEGLSDSVDSRRKFGVENDGLCLLVAYCFEAAQRDEKDMR